LEIKIPELILSIIVYTYLNYPLDLRWQTTNLYGKSKAAKLFDSFQYNFFGDKGRKDNYLYVSQL
jgi:hypothetical protein